MNTFRKNVNQWLATLGGNGSGFYLDDSGRCYLQGPEKIGLIIFVPKEGQELFFYAELMPIPVQMPAFFYEEAMSWNAMTELTGGLSIAFDTHTRSILAIVSRDAGMLDYTLFSNLLQNIFSRLASLRKRFVELSQGDFQKEKFGIFEEPANFFQCLRP